MMHRGLARSRVSSSIKHPSLSQDTLDCCVLQCGHYYRPQWWVESSPHTAKLIFAIVCLVTDFSYRQRLFAFQPVPARHPTPVSVQRDPWPPRLRQWIRHRRSCAGTFVHYILWHNEMSLSPFRWAHSLSLPSAFSECRNLKIDLLWDECTWSPVCVCVCYLSSQEPEHIFLPLPERGHTPTDPEAICGFFPLCPRYCFQSARCQ